MRTLDREDDADFDGDEIILFADVDVGSSRFGSQLVKVCTSLANNAREDGPILYQEVAQMSDVLRVGDTLLDRFLSFDQTVFAATSDTEQNLLIERFAVQRMQFPLELVFFAGVVIVVNTGRWLRSSVAKGGFRSVIRGGVYFQ